MNSKTKMVRITLVSLARSEYTECIKVPADMSEDAINHLVDQRYEDVDAGLFRDDPDYWERGHCYWEEAAGETADAILTQSDDGDIVIKELPPLEVSAAPSYVSAENKPFGSAQARLFMRELLDSVETLTGIADEHGAQTLSDLMYLQNAILSGGFIDHYPGESSVLDIAAALPSGDLWTKFIKISFDFTSNIDNNAPIDRLVFFEAYACGNCGGGPSFAKMRVDRHFCDKLTMLQSIVAKHKLSELRVYEGPDEWEEDDATEYLTCAEMVVTQNAFWFVDQPKEYEQHIETRITVIDEFINAVCKEDGSDVLYFGDNPDALKAYLNDAGD